jgi:uncharacterized protein YqjF (DUF2071 family)
VPAPLSLDLRDSVAWLGVTPFLVTGLHPRGAPPLPPYGSFLETNIRTYVTLDGVPGIAFLTLDATSRSAVAGARRTYRLPYRHAVGEMRRRGSAVRYRIARRAPAGALDAWYAPAGRAAPAPAGSLEAFLVERYRLYAVDGRHVVSADIHHPPWPIAPARARVGLAGYLPPALGDLGAPRLVHVARRQDVVVWRPRRVR